MSPNQSESESSAPVYLGAGNAEKGAAGHIERHITPGGHPVDYSQPGIPVEHRKYGNPIPLGLITFAVDFFLVGLYVLGARDVQSTAIVIPVLMLLGGISQTFVGWFEMFIGNTYSATIFGTFGGFNMCYAAIYIPSFGVLDAFKDANGKLGDSFNQAMGIFFVVWSIVGFFFVLASFRSSVAILSTLTFTTLTFVCLAIFNMTGTKGSQYASGAMACIAAWCGFWAALAGYWSPDTTYDFIRLPPISLAKED
ncbi:Ammonia transport outward protein 2 [Vanrija pseudolonga]|uniref:Ammonia transport outward protein 2 n=1 Tax=Vanrija pseudolonga TaxID=143232 RepID=A0AAF1BGB2_9TREE|nr:Ammonia transport outward protein 2 [Vanrija pseudolonga]